MLLDEIEKAHPDVFNILLQHKKIVGSPSRWSREQPSQEAPYESPKRALMRTMLPPGGLGTNAEASETFGLQRLVAILTSSISEPLQLRNKAPGVSTRGS